MFVMNVLRISMLQFAPIRSNDAFKMRVQQLISGLKDGVKFWLLEHPFINCKELESMHRSGRFSDLQLVAETGKVFKAHKFILAGEYSIASHDFSNNVVLVTQ
jgi:hypothetical protein